MTSSSLPPVAEGQVVAGKYRIERVLGAGGMGVVVAAHHLQLDQLVALEFLRVEALGSKEAVGRFVREGQVLARLKSPHVARVMDVGTLEHGEPYLVMEYLHGADLGTVVRERGALPITEAIGYMLQACEAVAEAHANGIIHRDLKPSNLFLTEGPDGLPLVKVLDFGVAKSLAVPGSGGDDVVTTTGALVGSPLYMSPEQIRNPKRVDSRTDVWSLGVILYELLSGITPFDGETSSGALAAIVADAPMPLRELRPEIPPDLDATVRHCLEKDADIRTGSILELARSLEEFVTAESRGSVLRIARMLGVAMPPVVRTGGDVDPTADHGKSATVPTWEGDAPPSQKMRRWVVAAAAGAVLGVVGFFALRRPQPPLTPVEAAPSVFAAPPLGSKAAANIAPPSATPSSSVSTEKAAASPAPSASAAPVAAPLQGKPRHGRNGNVDGRKQHVTEDTDDGTSDRK